MASKRVLAFDFGASSGRAILATYADGKIAMQEIHRFSNDPVNLCGTLYWDVQRLFFEIKQGITKAVHQGRLRCDRHRHLGGGFRSVGCTRPAGGESGALS